MNANRNIRILSLLLAGVAIGVSSCTKKVAAPDVNASMQTLVSTLEDNYSFSIFYHGLQRTGLDKLLTGATPYTLLIPDNDAFARDSILNDSALDQMDTAYLRQWLSYHIVPGTITSASVPQTVNNPYNSVAGFTLYFSRPIPGPDQQQGDIDDVMHINGDTVVTLDLTASDGVIQVLQRPLTLPVSSVQAYLAADSSQYSMLITGLRHFGLWDELTGPGPFTIWAPDNAAFEAVGITPDSVALLDTVRFQKALFNIYVLTPARVFQTDFYDIPGAASGGIFFVQNNGPYYFEQQYPSGIVMLDYYSDVVGYAAPWTQVDNIAVNGVVQGIGGLILRPDQEKK